MLGCCLPVSLLKEHRAPRGLPTNPLCGSNSGALPRREWVTGVHTTQWLVPFAKTTCLKIGPCVVGP